MAVGYADRISASIKVAGAINAAKTNSLITDSLVNGNSTLTALKTAIDGAVVRPDDAPLAIKCKKALDLGKAIGIFSETHGFTTVAGLIGASDAVNTSIRLSLF